jgi:hypothetical protein
MDMWTSRQSDLPTCPHGATTISDCRCWFPHETTRGHSGPLADKLNGFRGSELALGPIVTYSSKIGSLPLSTSLRWMNTVSQRDRMDRSTVYLSFSVPVPQ